MSQDVQEQVSTPTATMREKVDRLEAEMKQYPPVDIPVRHYFATGLYAREITIPAGVLAVGKIHKTQHINVLSQGAVTMVTPTGSAYVTAPYTWVVEPGKKAAAYAHTETVWTTFCVNPTDERDLDTLEAALISPAYLDQLEGDASCHSLPHP
jgi:hypothetical protein